MVCGVVPRQPNGRSYHHVVLSGEKRIQHVDMSAMSAKKPNVQSIGLRAGSRLVTNTSDRVSGGMTSAPNLPSNLT
ncbi:unnamed protein product [Protopolystoma xenopodis]|uniref:Uncharacterized protein n=1 Tax=Protopolystoma xenopodis TaxID=117903 RepID=A0A3S5AC77_9PLAT|nr:unnamed protein product [Protopolystoma xenopodis]